MGLRFSYFIYFLGVVLTAGCVSLSESREETQIGRAKFAVIQGVTDSTSTQVAVLVPRKEEIQLSLARPEGRGNLLPASSKRSAGLDGEWDIVTALFNELSPATLYVLSVARQDGTGLETRKLFTLPTSKKTFRLAIASCMDDAFAERGNAMWSALLKTRPDVLFLIGDNVYADRPLFASPVQLWKRYVQTRLALSLFRSDILIPVFATWDDHDYGMNDGDSDYVHKEKSLEIFNTFFPRLPTANFERGPGVSALVNLFGQRFFFLDDRSFRSPPSAKKDQTHWGKAQEDWLFQRLNEKQSLAWLLNGDQFFGRYHPFESYEGRHPQSFANFVNRMNQVRSAFLLVSGDRHLTEIAEIEASTFGRRTYELTSSGIHAKVFPGSRKKHPNPRAVTGADGTFNFLIVDVETQPHLKVRAIAYGEKEEKLFSYDLKL